MEQQILRKQSYQLDSVSGATVTSEAIMAAARIALSKAEKDGALGGGQ